MVVHRISVIIPLRLTGATFEGELRLRRICQTIPRDLFDILIVDYGTEAAYRAPILALQSDGIEVACHPAPDKVFSIGPARDFGVQMARNPVVMFNDVDFIAPAQVYRGIHGEVMRRDMASNMFDFFCVPALFLTEEGTKLWFDKQKACEQFVERFDVEWLEANPNTIQFTAFGSSAMVINRHHYLSLGGHDKGFRGHGAEDYDLLHRLSSLAPKGPRPHDYYTDYKTNTVRQYWGFRPFFALYGLEVFARGLFLIHLWHPRRSERGYFRPGANFRRLRKVMRSFDRNGAQPTPLPDLHSPEQWIVVCNSKEDRALLRQFLPLAAAARMISAKRFAGKRIVAEARSFGAIRIVIAPDVAGDIAEFREEFRQNGLTLTRIIAEEARAIYRFVSIGVHGRSETRAHIAANSIANRRKPLFFWAHAELPGLPVVSSGTVPGPVALEDPLFASFHSQTLGGPAEGVKPIRRKKSSMKTRFWRWITRT